MQFSRSDFLYHLPDEQIAQYPLAERSASRLLLLDRQNGAIRDAWFRELPERLNPGDLLVFNDTRVIPARLYGRKDSGGQVEILLERLVSAQDGLAHVRASRAPRPGSRIRIDGSAHSLEVRGRRGELFEIHCASGLTALLDSAGHVPLPPYIERADGTEDRERYQTLFARQPGAVAAPTAGLHFDQAVLQRLEARGVQRGTLTLHVGAGTFQPVREEDLSQHRMHEEFMQLDAELCRQVRTTRAGGGRVVATGTTAVRALETASASGELQAYQGDTRLFITPGYQFRSVDALLTNFHLPGSTLLMLVAAFGGYAPVMAAYRHAVAAGYRFYSYGDAMLIADGLVPETHPAF